MLFCKLVDKIDPSKITPTTLFNGNKYSMSIKPMIPRAFSQAESSYSYVREKETQHYYGIFRCFRLNIVLICLLNTSFRKSQ